MTTTLGRVLCLTALVICTPLAAEPLTFESVVELATRADHEIDVLERRLRDQLEDLGLKSYLDEISLRLSGSLNGDSDAETDATVEGAAVLSGSLEIIPQLILDGSLEAADTSAEVPGASDDVFTGTLGLTLLPLADPAGKDRERLLAESTSIDLEAAMSGVASQAALLLVNVVEAELNLVMLREEQAIAERVLTNTQTLHERDRATDAELDGAEAAARTGERQIVRALLDIDRTKESLASDLGLPVDALEFPAVDDLDLEERIVEAQNLLNSTSAAELTLQDGDVRKSELDIRSAQLDVDAARRFDPTISITASAELPDFSYSVGAEVVLSPSQWDAEEVTDAQANLDNALSEYDAALRLAEYDAQAALNEIRYALEDLGFATEHLEDAQHDLEEADFRLSRGAITQLERDQAELAVVQAEHAVVLARIKVAQQLLSVQYGYSLIE